VPTLKRRLIIAFVLLASIIVASIASCRSAVGIVDGKLGPCPSSPNCVNSEFADQESSIPPLTFEGDPDAALASLVEFVRNDTRSRVDLVDGDYVHAVYWTERFRFHDDVEFRLDRDAKVIHVRSASRFGYSDLGENRRRVESIRERWKNE